MKFIDEGPLCEIRFDAWDPRGLDLNLSSQMLTAHLFNRQIRVADIVVCFDCSMQVLVWSTTTYLILWRQDRNR